MIWGLIYFLSKYGSIIKVRYFNHVKDCLLHYKLISVNDIFLNI